METKDLEKLNQELIESGDRQEKILDLIFEKIQEALNIKLKGENND